jgi:hypothetical protein
MLPLESIRRRGVTIVKNNYNMPLMLWNLTIYLLPKLLSYMECLRVLYAFMLLDWERCIGFYRNSDNVIWEYLLKVLYAFMLLDWERRIGFLLKISYIIWLNNGNLDNLNDSRRIYKSFCDCYYVHYLSAVVWSKIRENFD